MKITQTQGRSPSPLFKCVWELEVGGSKDNLPLSPSVLPQESYCLLLRQAFPPSWGLPMTLDYESQGTICPQLPQGWDDKLVPDFFFDRASEN